MAQPAWFDQSGVEEELRQKQQYAKASRYMSFKIANYDTSDVPMLTCGPRVDWLGVPVQCFLAKLPTLNRGIDSCLSDEGCFAVGGYQV